MQSRATNYKISWLRREESNGSLDLSPKFQRRPVWSDEQASFLIDTILNGLPVPEIYIRSKSTPSGETQYEVVDGQQRIRSVLRFASNDFELVGQEVSPKWLGKRLEDLVDSEKSNFWDYDFVVRDVSGATDIEIRDLFKRLNIHSVVLNDQELRNAKYNGEFLHTMETLADDEWWLDSRIVNVRQIRRMEDVEFVSELFVGIIAGPQDKKKTLDNYYAEFESAMPQKTDWVAQFERTRDFIKILFDQTELKKWSGKSDFYSLFLALEPIAQKTLSAGEKKRLLAELKKFRMSVDEAKKKDAIGGFPKDVKQYTEALVRASTDMGRRETRLRILENRIKKALRKAN